MAIDPQFVKSCYEQAQRDRVPYEEDWRNCARLALPQQYGGWTSPDTPAVQSARQARVQVLDATAMKSVPRFVALLNRIATPDGYDWHGLKASNRGGVKAWAERWHALGTLPFGARYNDALQAITDEFSGRGSDPAKPNANALNQLRTNEAALAYPWQFREFRIDRSGALANVEVRNTPDQSVLAEPQDLSDFIRAHPDDDIPSRFTGGKAEIASATFEWPAMALNNNNFRHNFAMKTCNGCHGAETGPKTDAGAETFRQIGGRKINAQATLSRFLTGTPTIVQDPSGKIQTFCDLKIRQKALHEALHPPAPENGGVARPDDLSVARSRRDRSD